MLFYFSVNGFAGSPGGDWSGDKSTNQMKRQLTEAQTLLDEEKSKTKSLTDRLNVLRTELNQTKSSQVNAQRMLDDLQVIPVENIWIHLFLTSSQYLGFDKLPMKP